MKKKIRYICLVPCMCLNLVTPTLAHTASEAESNAVTLYDLGHGEYTTVPVIRSPMTRRSTNNNYDNFIPGTVSKHEGILAVSETSYWAPTGNNLNASIATKNYNNPSKEVIASGFGKLGDPAISIKIYVDRVYL